LQALVISERIKTTESKAKALRSAADKLITWGKKDTLHYRRLAFSYLQDHNLVKKLFDDIAPRFKDITGGYTRVLAMGFRKGDAAKMSILELTKTDVTKKVREQKENISEDRIKEQETESKKVAVERKAKKISENVKKVFKRKPKEEKNIKGKIKAEKEPKKK